MRSPITKALLVATALATALALALPAGASAAGGGSSRTRFADPVKVTPDLGYGYEPSLVVDPNGNIFATAHKENWQLLLAPDENSPTFTRSMSWAWTSVDGGKTFVDIPGLTPASLEQHEFGDEGDMALDDANHLYFVDTNVGDDTITRWTVTGPGLDQMSLDFTRPVIPTAQPVDDRPWVVAHGDGNVFYFGNEGNKSHFGGRYLVYPSHDGGQTFDPVGTALPDSGWCRPAADHTPGSPYVYATCTNDAGKLYAYVSPDDGATWNRYDMGTYNATISTSYQSWPTVQVAPDASIWALFNDAATLTPSNTPDTTRLRLFHSTDHGQTWSEQDITPVAGHYDYAWLSVDPNRSDRLGLGVYYRPDGGSPWQVYGAIWKAGRIPRLVPLDADNPVSDASYDRPPGDYLGSFFGPDGALSVVWTRRVLALPGVTTLERDIYYARSVVRTR